jgi:hypothetical protein
METNLAWRIEEPVDGLGDESAGDIGLLAASGDRLLTGEERLMLAVLEDALREALWSPRRKKLIRRIRENAWWWLAGGHPGDAEWPFSFERICETLCIDAPRLRRRLATTVEAKGQPIPPWFPR